MIDSRFAGWRGIWDGVCGWVVLAGVSSKKSKLVSSATWLDLMIDSRPTGWRGFSDVGDSSWSMTDDWRGFWAVVWTDIGETDER